MGVYNMYFPYLRGRQFELIALRELLETDKISDKVIPIIEPVKPTSTLLKTLQAFSAKNRKVAVVYNPVVGDFESKLADLKNEESQVATGLTEILDDNENIIKAYIMDSEIIKEIKDKDDKSKYLIINLNRDCLEDFLEVYDNCLPKYTLIPDDRAFKRVISDTKILLEDCFRKRVRNVDYIECDDEFFADNHLYYRSEKFIGFGDYSIVGEEYNESGFAPVAVAIHIVYFNDKQEVRIHHFVSDSNEGTEDPAGKFGEALDKLVMWCEAHSVTRTLGLSGFYECFETGKYPGLGTVKKLSIMHHLELMSSFLEDEK